MRFEHRAGMMLFHNDRGGSHAAMFDPNGLNCWERPDANSFNDQAGKYTWGFAWPLPLEEGQRFTFAAVEYAATCEVRGGELVLLDDPGEERFARELGGRPVSHFNKMMADAALKP